MKYYLIAGEASGDLHGSNLIREIIALDGSARIRCWGGNLMEAAGGQLVKHYKDLAFMGFVEVALNLRTILRNLKMCKADILADAPDVLVLIDYPGFNLRIAAWARQHRMKVVFYISPQVWAWKENRVAAIKKNVDLMIVILPFEKGFYARWHYNVVYVGHPLVHEIDTWYRTAIRRRLSDQPIIALLPGSRKQEILKKLPIMLEVGRCFPQHRLVVARAPGLEDAFYAALLKPYHNVSSVSNDTYNLLSQADAALVTSGTATLETALFGVPQVVCYKGNPVSYQIARRLIKIKYISLVNLIMDKAVVKELIQDELTAANCARELNLLLFNPQHKSRVEQDYHALKKLLGENGNASAKAARCIIDFMQP